MANQILEYDELNEKVRNIYESYINLGIKQNRVSSDIELSGCSLSNFKDHKRILVDSYLYKILEQIKQTHIELGKLVEQINQLISEDVSNDHGKV